MVYAARQIRLITSGTLPRKVKRPRGKCRTQLHLLQGLPGVGPERARCLLESFGSVEAVVTASTHELLKVSGIGVYTAEAIRWAVSEASCPYILEDHHPKREIFISTFTEGKLK
jgi:ERCC4-type nuclease